MSLKPCAILCKILQEDDACIVRAIEAILKTNKSIKILKDTSFDDLPTVKKAMERVGQFDGMECTSIRRLISLTTSMLLHSMNLIK